jgi:hypothetical protein
MLQRVQPKAWHVVNSVHTPSTAFKVWNVIFKCLIGMLSFCSHMVEHRASQCTLVAAVNL